MKLRMAWLATLLTVALTSGVQAADEWKTYRYPQDGFAAEFPTPPVPQSPKLNPQRNISDTQYWSDLGEVAYGVDAALFHHKVIAGQPRDKQIQNVIAAVRSSLKCDIRSQKAITLPGAAGREIVFDKCPNLTGGAKQRIFIAGDRLFQVLVLGNKPGLAESADTKRFLESFSLMAQ
jgi:hypothetical protein